MERCTVFHQEISNLYNNKMILNMKTKLFTLFIALTISTSALFAESGTCGENATWNLTDSVLTISGTGLINDYSSNAPWYNVRQKIKSVNISDGITHIGKESFLNCSNILSIDIPNSVSSIGNSCFFGCTKLQSVIIPDGVTSIGFGTFADCYNLTSITIPNSVTSIGYGSFRLCQSLTSIVIPSNVTSIGDLAFNICTSLKSIEIPSSVDNIGNGAFTRCDSMTLVKLNSNTITSKDNFSSIFGLQVRKYILGDSIKCIGDSAFSGCGNITSISMSNGITNIGNYAFQYCTGLTSITIPRNVTNIGPKAFHGCINLDTVTINSNDIVSKDYLYGDNDNNFRHLFSDNGAYVNLYIIGEGVTSIGNLAFYNCSGSIELPNSLTSIGEASFAYCRFDSITIPDNVTSIGATAFSNCKYMKKITIPNRVTSIGAYAFSGCVELTSATIGSSVTSIGNEAFYGCSTLTSISNYATIPQQINDGVFYNVNKNTCILYVPKGSVDLYKTASVWSDFFNIVGVDAPEGVENITMDAKQSTKTIHNGHVIIHKGDKTYTLTGQQVK